MAKNVHWLFPAFLSLARESNITADDAIQRLQTMYPGQPVKLIVSNFGDMREVAKALEESANTPQGVDLAALGQPSGQGSDETHTLTPAEIETALQAARAELDALKAENASGTGQIQSGTLPDPSRSDAFIRDRAASQQRAQRTSDRKAAVRDRLFGEATGTDTQQPPAAPERDFLSQAILDKRRG